MDVPIIKLIFFTLGLVCLMKNVLESGPYVRDLVVSVKDIALNAMLKKSVFILTIITSH